MFIHCLVGRGNESVAFAFILMWRVRLSDEE